MILLDFLTIADRVISDISSKIRSVEDMRRSVGIFSEKSKNPIKSGVKSGARLGAISPAHILP